jgi:signal transduction histidine kinase
MNGKYHRLFVLLYVILLIAVLCFCFVGGYSFINHFFEDLGRRPHVLIAQILYGFWAIVLFFCCVSIVRGIFELYYRKYPEKRRHNQMFDNHHGLLRSTMEAMNRIAQGDFSVLIPLDKNDPFSDLAESVNKMTRELGTMEQARQEFISNVSHEIQSPLTSIGGFAALLKNTTLTDEQRDHYLTVIEAESKRLSSLSENLLKLSALEAGNETLAMKDYRLDKQLESIALMLEPQWSAKNLFVEAELDKLTVHGDEGLLSQVWINLLHNAIKFTPEGGNIHIALSADSGELCCQISDSGIGIAPTDRIHIFERFYKVDKARDRSLGGNGLGLSLVKRIVELHGGRVEVESEIGKGTTFLVVLLLVSRSNGTP